MWALNILIHRGFFVFFLKTFFVFFTVVHVELLNYCVCTGHTNTNLSGHWIICFPNKIRNRPVHVKSQLFMRGYGLLWRGKILLLHRQWKEVRQRCVTFLPEVPSSLCMRVHCLQPPPQNSSFIVPWERHTRHSDSLRLRHSFGSKI